MVEKFSKITPEYTLLSCTLSHVVNDTSSFTSPAFQRKGKERKELTTWRYIFAKSPILDLRQGSEYASGDLIFRLMRNVIVLRKANEIDNVVNVVNVTKWLEQLVHDHVKAVGLIHGLRYKSKLCFYTHTAFKPQLHHSFKFV